MCLTEHLAVICLESIDDTVEREEVIKAFKETGKEILAISESQLVQFAGNMLSVANDKGEKFLVMSGSARNSLEKEQVDLIEKYYSIISSPIETIETLGGGSARCMMAEVFLPQK